MIANLFNLLSTVLAIGIVAVVVFATGFYQQLDLKTVLVMAVILFVSAVFQRLRSGWLGDALQPNRPQSITHYTKETPSQISRAGCFATIKLFGFTVVLAFVLVALLGFFTGIGPFNWLHDLVASIAQTAVLT